MIPKPIRISILNNNVYDNPYRYKITLIGPLLRNTILKLWILMHFNPLKELEIP